MNKKIQSKNIDLKFLIKKYKISYPVLKTLIRKNKISDLKNFEKKEDKIFDNSKIKNMLVFENEDFAIINKPEGIAMQGENDKAKDSIFSLTNGFIVHKIDKTTSGLAIIAKNTEAAKIFSEKFQNHEIKKEYLALCSKIFHTKVGDSTFLNNSKHNEKKEFIWQNEIKNKECLTKAIIIKEFSKYNLLKIQPVTGRKHQIRIHCSINQMPIVGDLRYNGVDFKRIMLHCSLISFDFKNQFFKFENTDLIKMIS